MLPFERLRYLAHYAGDDRSLVVEAAECLGEFADDPQLLTVCRRLLAHHPVCGPLWWLCARVVTASDAREAAREALRLIQEDRTSARLASLLPFPHDEPIAVLGWPELTAAALGDRPDLDVAVVRCGDEPPFLRFGSFAHAPRVADLTEVMVLEPTHLLVEVRAASPTEALVPAGTADVVWSVPSAELWLVAGVGRLLPARMFGALRDLARAGEDDHELVDVRRATRVAGPHGLDPPERLAERVDCPVAPELLRL